MNRCFLGRIQIATPVIALFVATLMLMECACVAQVGAEPDTKKTADEPTTSREDAIALAKLWTALEGDWQFKQQADRFGFRMLDVTFNKTCEDASFYQKSTQKVFRGKLSGGVFCMATELRPFRNDLNSYYLASALDGKRLVLTGKDSITDEAVTIEILDADKIDDHSEQIMLRITKARGGAMVWYRSGTLLEFTRKPKVEPKEKQPEASPKKTKPQTPSFP